MGPDIVKCEGFNTVRKQSSSKRRPAPKHYEMAEGVTAAQVPEKLEDAIAGGFIRQVSAPKPTQEASVTEAIVTEEPYDPTLNKQPVVSLEVSEFGRDPESLLAELSLALKTRDCHLVNEEGRKVEYLEIVQNHPHKGVSF